MEENKIFTTSIETNCMEMKIACCTLNELIETQNILNAYVEILTKTIYSGVDENETL